VLRPQPGAGRTARRAQTMGFDVAAYPLFAIEPRAWIGPPVDAIDALLLTSANALRHGGAQMARYREVPAFVIGDATAEAARNAGFTHVIRGASFVDRLVRDIAARGVRRLLHLAGEKVAPYDAAGLDVTRITVYAAETRGDGEALRALMAAGDIALVHSARAGRRLAQLTPPSRRRHLHVIAISAAAGIGCGEGWASLQAAGTPDDEAMLALARALCKDGDADGRDTPAP